MAYYFRCAYCPPVRPFGNDSDVDAHSFVSQKEFLSHLKEYHLIVKATPNGKIYICCYGPSNSCSFIIRSSLDCSPNMRSVSSSEFANQRDYEQHLVSCHLYHTDNGNKSTDYVALRSVPKSLTERLMVPLRWNALQSVVNLPAALNDPLYRQLDIFSRTWGEHFERAEVIVSPRLPSIDEKHFEQYLSKLGSRGCSPKTPRPLNRNLILQAVRGFDPARNFPTPSIATNPNDSDNSHQPSLDSIPSIFFDPNFSLQNSQTFSQIIPLHLRISSGDRCKSQPHGSFTVVYDQTLDFQLIERQQQLDFRTQHDRLTQYLDVVEVHLAEQVSKKSSIFFEAVCCHDVVREQLVETLSQVKVVREKLQQIDSSITMAVMRLHGLVRRKTNLLRLLRKLQMMSNLQVAQPTIQLLLRTNDFCAALDLVASTQELLQSSQQDGPCPDPGSLAEPRQIVCLKHVNAQLVEISRFVRHMIEAEFEAALRQFLERPRSNQNDSGPDLVSCLLGLLHIRRHDFVSALRAELIQQIKYVLHHTNAEDVVATGSKPQLTLKDQLRCVSNEMWLQTITSRCATVRELLDRAEEAVNIFIETMSRYVTSNDSSGSPVHTDSSESQITPNLTTIKVEFLVGKLRFALNAASLTAQKILADLVADGTRYKVLDGSIHSSDGSCEPSNVAEDQVTGRLSVDECIYLLCVLDSFQQCIQRFSTSESSPPNRLESSGSFLASQSSTDVHVEPPQPGVRVADSPLTRILVNVTRTLVDSFHTERLAKLEITLNQERWQLVPVPRRVQQLVDETFGRRLDNMTKSDTTVTRWPSHANVIPLPGSVNGQLTTSTVEDGIGSSLCLRGEHYVVVGTVLLLLPILLDYVHLVQRLPCKPYSVHEVVGRLSEFLNSFNSRTCQLVLGAEARKSANLTTISSRNLALASRSLQLVMQCIVTTQAHVAQWSTVIESNDSRIWAGHSRFPKEVRHKPVLQHVVDLYQEHIAQIDDKLFNLLSNRLHDQLSAWQVRPPTPSLELRAICRALGRMVEMTSDVLPADRLTPILLRAHNEFKSRLRHRLHELAVIADGGPEQSLVDSELTFYLHQVRKLTPQLRKFEDDFSDVWPGS